MGGLFPSLPPSPPHPFQTSVNYLAFPEDYLSGPSTRVSRLSLRQGAAKYVFDRRERLNAIISGDIMCSEGYLMTLSSNVALNN